MTEFISRKYGQEGYEVIVRSDSLETFALAEDFARSLVGPAKGKTNREFIRYSGEHRLAEFFAERVVSQSLFDLLNPGANLSATELQLLTARVTDAIMHWLRQPVSFLSDRYFIDERLKEMELMRLLGLVDPKSEIISEKAVRQVVGEYGEA